MTAESGLTKSAEFIRLEDGAKIWAKNILQKGNGRNENAANEMRASGFDIKEQAREVIRWYKINSKEIVVNKGEI